MVAGKLILVRNEAQPWLDHGSRDLLGHSLVKMTPDTSILMRNDGSVKVRKSLSGCCRWENSRLARFRPRASAPLRPPSRTSATVLSSPRNRHRCPANPFSETPFLPQLSLLSEQASLL